LNCSHERKASKHVTFEIDFSRIFSDWSYETKDDLGNKVIKQKRD